MDSDARSHSVLARRGFAPVVALGGALALLVALLAGSPASADVQSRLAAKQAAEQQLRSAIAGETARIEATSSGLARATRRLEQLQAQSQARQAELVTVQHDLVRARNHLTTLENRQLRAVRALTRNLVEVYKSDRPDLTAVLLSAHGFADLLERVDFLKLVGRQNAAVLRRTKTARARVTRQANELVRMQRRTARLAAQVLGARNQAAALQGAILSRRETQLRARATNRSRLAGVRAQIASLRSQQAEIVQRVTAPAPTTPNTSIATNAGGHAQPPDGAPAAVAQVIAAGNAIAGLPYSYGGGHASFQASAYDCSGSVSYALAAAGLVSSPLASTGFMSWGEAGPGKWITVYANAGHAFMVVGGWRFDTGALRSDGTRWSQSMRGTGGFVARHPPGL